LGSQGHSIGAMLRVVSIAAVLGALVTLAAEHRTQAQNVSGVIFADAFAPNSSMKSEEDQRDFGYVEGRYIGENSAGKISSAGGSGGRSCEMSPEEFAKFYPPLLDWIRTTLIGSMHIEQLTMGGCLGLLGFESAKEFWEHHPLYHTWKFKGWACQFGNRAPPALRESAFGTKRTWRD